MNTLIQCPTLFLITFKISIPAERSKVDFLYLKILGNSPRKFLMIDLDFT